MSTKELISAVERQAALKAKLEEAEKKVMELKKTNTRKQSNAITRAILSIEDKSVTNKILGILDSYVKSTKDRKILGLSTGEIHENTKF